MQTKRTPQKGTGEEKHPEPGVCPFCKEGRLIQSPSGKNLVCQKCGRIVVKAKDAQAVQQAGERVPSRSTALHEVTACNKMPCQSLSNLARVCRQLKCSATIKAVDESLAAQSGLDLTHIEWLIVGGESGPGFRPMPYDWPRELLAKARPAGTAFFFKQSAAIRTEMGTKLDGREIKEYPEGGVGSPIERAQAGLGGILIRSSS